MLVIASCLSAAMTLLLLESALIYSELTLFYHSFMIFVVLVTPAIVLQLLADAWRATMTSDPVQVS